MKLLRPKSKTELNDIEKQNELTLQEVENFLINKFNVSISNVSELSSGMFSRSYSCKLNDDELVLRLNNDAKDFKKDIYARENFGNKLSIPEILECGSFNERFCFAIMHRCKGVTHDRLDRNEAKIILPEIINIVEKIRSIEVSGKEGYGLLDENGKGQYESWSSSIASFYNHKLPQIDIEELFDGSILRREIFDYHYKKMFELLSFCSEEKYLVHGDFGFDNLLVSDGKVTGVIDWAESKYGDFLYDVAWLDFWSNNIDYASQFKRYYAENKNDVSYFDERIHCYRLHIGLSGLIISAFLNDKQDYEQVQRRLRK